MVAAVIALALAVAEGKLLFYSYTRRDLSDTVQGLLLQERAQLAGRQVFMDSWTHADRFVVEHVIGATPRETPSVSDFITEARRGDFIVRPHPDHSPGLLTVRTTRRHRLCQRAADTTDPGR